MERFVSGFSGSFYQDLLYEYKRDGLHSFLYRYFWRESIRELLEKRSIPFSASPDSENAGPVRKLLRDQAKQHPELVPLMTPEKKCPDFWEALWLNDAGREAGLISDPDYCLWLAEYLAAHSIFFTDTSLWDGPHALDPLLRACLGKSPGVRELKSKDRKAPEKFFASQIAEDLKELAFEIRQDRAKISARLGKLRETGDLSRLTAQLEQMALHIKIKNWFQYSGYPLVTEKARNRAKSSAKEPRKRDFSMHLLDAWLAGGRGGSFPGRGKPEGGRDWQLDANGFCIMGPEKIEALQKALEHSGSTYFYIPLGVDLHSGCVFFLAGKDLYETVYRAKKERVQKLLQKAEACGAPQKTREAAKKAYAATIKEWNAYNARPERFCFDYFHLDARPGQAAPFFGAAGSGFGLRPKFHKNAGQNFRFVLNNFKWYCIEGDLSSPDAGSPRQAVQAFNLGDEVTGALGALEAFRWAFADPDDDADDWDAFDRDALSTQANDAFRSSRDKPRQEPWDRP